MAATAPAAAAANQAPGAGPAVLEPQRGSSQPTPAAGPSRAAAGKEPGPLRSFFVSLALPVSRETGDTRGRVGAPAPRGIGRLGLTRPRGRPGCRSRAICGADEGLLAPLPREQRTC